MTRLTFISLVLVTAMVSTASAQGGIASCCRRVSNTFKKVPPERLKDYYVQHKPSCPLHTVVFITVRNKRICCDPKDPWTNMSMAYLDEKNSQHPTASRSPHAATANDAASTSIQ